MWTFSWWRSSIYWKHYHKSQPKIWKSLWTSSEESWENTSGCSKKIWCNYFYFIGFVYVNLCDCQWKLHYLKNLYRWLEILMSSVNGFKKLKSRFQSLKVSHLSLRVSWFIWINKKLVSSITILKFSLILTFFLMFIIFEIINISYIIVLFIKMFSNHIFIWYL